MQIFIKYYRNILLKYENIAVVEIFSLKCWEIFN